MERRRSDSGFVIVVFVVVVVSTWARSTTDRSASAEYRFVSVAIPDMIGGPGDSSPTHSSYAFMPW